MSNKNSEIRVYISGPITGYENGNQQAFKSAKDFLLELGYKVCNPHDIFGHDSIASDSSLTEEQKYNEYMKLDIIELCKCDRVMTIEGWEKSKGANIEVNLARQLGIKVDSYIIYQKEASETINRLKKELKTSI